MYESSIHKAELESKGFPVSIGGEILWFYWTYHSNLKLYKTLSDENSDYHVKQIDPDQISIKSDDGKTKAFNPLWMMEAAVNCPLFLWCGFQHYKDFDMTPQEIGEALYEWFYHECPNPEQYNNESMMFLVSLSNDVQASMRNVKGEIIDPLGLRPKPESKKKSAKRSTSKAPTK